MSATSKARESARQTMQGPPIVHTFDESTDITPAYLKRYPWRVEAVSDDFDISIQQPCYDGASIHDVCPSAEIRISDAGTGMRVVLDSPIVDFVLLERFAIALVSAVRATRRRHPELVRKAK